MLLQYTNRVGDQIILELSQSTKVFSLRLLMVKILRKTIQIASKVNLRIFK
nr:MAG TPA: hypothetical protein [Caudoviricetes sp.]